ASDLAAYRVVQEALTNTLRHARGATATVTIRHTGVSLEIVAADTGASAQFPEEKAIREGKASAGTGTQHGLIGMRERLALVGGELAEAGQQAGGYLVRAVIPLGGSETSNGSSHQVDLVR